MPSQRSERAMEDSPAAGAREPPVFHHALASPNAHAVAGRAAGSEGAGAMSLHVSKLRGISLDMRLKLKRQGVSYTHQLLSAAGTAERCRRLAARSGIDEASLTRLVRCEIAESRLIGSQRGLEKRLSPTQTESNPSDSARSASESRSDRL